MEAGARSLIERFVSALIPPASREHVLGDLYQRNRSEWQYVLDACRVVPHVIWSQVRRTASPTLLIAEFALVYLAFASAAVSVVGFFGQPFAVYRLTIAAIVALVTLVLRDAYAAAKRSSNEVSADALLAILTILITEQLLLVAGIGLALPRVITISGSIASLIALSGIRKVAHECDARSKDDGRARIESPIGPQKDLNRWWWITAVFGVVAWAFLYTYPVVRQFRPWLIAWLFVFIAIGLYQRRKIHWPHRTGGSLSGDQVYRAALARQRDAQSKWPFRRGPVLVVVYAALAFSLWQEVTNSGVVPRINFALAVYVFVVTGWLVSGRLLTNRAARDFDRELALWERRGMRSDESSR